MESNSLYLSPEFCRLVFEHLGTFAILDRSGRYVFVSQKWAERMNCAPENAIGRHVTEFFPYTRAMEAMEKKAPILAHPIKISDASDAKQFTSYLPLFEGHEVVGCVIQTVFHNIDEAICFSDNFNKVYRERNYYKQELRKLQGSRYQIENIIGESKSILALKENIRLAARSASNVLIEGETGTGKELVAHAIHDLSNRAFHPMIKVNCAAIPLELAESELFGYEYGAFSGAKAGGKSGKFELAHKGTLFLDEINQMSALIQPKLLRVIQEGELERVGGSKNIKIDVRLIAAANASLEDMVDDKLFRSDLYYRLNVINIRIPPLRDRLSDIPLLVSNMIERLNLQLGTTVEGVSPEALENLCDYAWPGNIRELQNVLERAMNARLTGMIPWQYFSEYFQQKRKNFLTDRATFRTPIRETKRNLERSMIYDALMKNRGNKKRTAESLGISRTMLYRKIQEYGISEFPDYE